MPKKKQTATIVTNQARLDEALKRLGAARTLVREALNSDELQPVMLDDEPSKAAAVGQLRAVWAMIRVCHTELADASVELETER